jgi:hypothetical protein
MISTSFSFFPINFFSYLFITIFFTLTNFLNLYFFFQFYHSTLKLVRNWASWLSPDLGFHGLQVWEINLGLRDLLRFACFFLFVFSCSFSFIFQYLFNWLDFFFYLFSIEFSLILKMMRVISDFFCLSFVVKLILKKTILFLNKTKLID